MACTAPASDEGSTSDEVRTGDSIHIPGTSALPPGVLPTQRYVETRAVDILVRVGRLTAAEAAVIRRADGMLASSPADGRVSVDELAQLAAPDFSIMLLPAEKAALVTVWRVMKASSVTKDALPLALPGALAPLDVRSANLVRTEPTPLVWTPRTTFTVAEIGNFSGEWSKLVQRIEAAFDDDGDPTTVTLADLERAKSAPALTPAEIVLLGKIATNLKSVAKAEVDHRILATPQTLSAELHDMPAAGVIQASIALATGLDLVVDRSGTYVEKRRRTHPSFGAKLETSFAYEESLAYGFGAARDMAVVELDPATGRETGNVASDGMTFPAPPRDALVEIWKDGEEQMRVRIAANTTLPATRTTDLQDFYGLELFARSGDVETRLVKRSRESGTDGAGSKWAIYHYVANEDGGGGGVPEIQNAWLHPEAYLVPGRYTFPLVNDWGDWGTMRVDVHRAPADPLTVTRQAVRVSFDRAFPATPVGTVHGLLPGDAGPRTRLLLGPAAPERLFLRLGTVPAFGPSTLVANELTLEAIAANGTSCNATLHLEDASRIGW